MHGHATPFFASITIWFSNNQAEDTPRCITPYPLMKHGYYSKVICNRSHEQAKNQPKFDEEL